MKFDFSFTADWCLLIYIFWKYQYQISSILDNFYLSTWGLISPPVRLDTSVGINSWVLKIISFSKYSTYLSFQIKDRVSKNWYQNFWLFRLFFGLIPYSLRTDIVVTDDRYDSQYELIAKSQRSDTTFTEKWRFNFRAQILPIAS